MALAFHQRLYKYVLWTSYLVFTVTYLGFWKQGSAWLSTIETILNVYIALFLVYNFNPFHKHKMDEFSREIAFSAGILLLVTKGVTHVLSIFGMKDDRREDTRELSEAVYEVVTVLGG